ncbi:MAG: ferritin-like domain-containing protein [Kofleriaceae bacterium]|nr:ferritin-like domain-containing protein [Myxococcales bacterium]MCB9561138.1 ferritin-like domain-containing protein [Kofleriaceae bacterium]MCB9571335.1 ferritin-like domain-containing protein [Kofleriaceae bacterium]
MSAAPSAADANARPSIETLEAILDVTYTWGYQETRQQLRNLYDKATHAQWDATAALPWHREVDITKPMGPENLLPLFGSDIWNRMTPAERVACNGETSAWTLSQFLHGEQGALLAAAQLVDCVPDLDSKLYGASQVYDEARHVDVYNRYLHEKIGFSYPVNTHLKTLLDMILKDSRWDMKFLGMQIMVEGLAMAAFGMIRNNTEEPLLRDLTAYVMGDEARHVAFGVLSLKDYYRDQPESVRAEREDFVYEAARLMRDRFLFQEVWEKMGLPVQECMDIALHNQGQIMFRQMLFAKIVPAIKKMDLLSDRQRKRFQELGILQFENWEDPFADLEREEQLRRQRMEPAAVA